MRTIGSLFLAAAFAASGQELPQAGGEQVYVTAIEVVADVRDAKGALPADLKPTDFVIVEDGVERTVVGLDYLRRERIAGAIDTTPETTTAATPATPEPARERTLWQNVIYFETSLANGTGRMTAAKEMMKHIDALVQMGTVDVVFANPTPVALVRGSRDAAAIRRALEKVASSPGSNQLAVHRRDYLRDIAALSGLQVLSGASGRATPKNEFTVGPSNALPYIQQEIVMISDFRDSLVAWLSSYRRHTPRNLILMTDGFDLDPVEFYGKSLPPQEQMELRSYVSQSTLGNTSERLARSLASGAWTTLSIPSDNSSDGWVDDATVSAIGRVHASISAHPTTNPKAFLIRPLDPLHAVSEATGGKIVANSAQIGDALEGLDDRVKLTYQVDRKPDGKARKIEVRSRRPNLKVRAARFATSATAEDMAQTRALGLLKPSSYLGDLKTEGSIEWGPASAGQKNGTLRAVTDVDLIRRLLPPGAKAQFRITMAVQVGRDSIVVNRSVSDYVLAGKPFRFRTPIDVPSNASMIVLVIEEITTGVWGSTRLQIPTATTPKS